MWQPSCWKLGEKFNSNLGNEVAKMRGKKDDLGQKLNGKKICGNGITEMGGKKNNSNWFVAMLLPKWKEKKCGNWFVAMELSKWKGKKKEFWQLICGNRIAEMGGKKIVAIDCVF